MYHGRAVRAFDIEGANSFVYVIENNKTGKRYIGKKRLRRKITRKPLKGKKRRRITYKVSDWADYWGSNEPLQNDVKQLGPKSFTRTILRFCDSLSEASYYEARYMLQWDVLLYPNKFYNDWVMVRVTRAHLRRLHQ